MSKTPDGFWPGDECVVCPPDELRRLYEPFEKALADFACRHELAYSFDQYNHGDIDESGSSFSLGWANRFGRSCSVVLHLGWLYYDEWDVAEMEQEGFSLSVNYLGVGTFHVGDISETFKTYLEEAKSWADGDWSIATLDPGLDFWIAKLQSPVWLARFNAVLALGRTGNRATIEPLVKALEDRPDHIPAAAAKALGRFGDERALEPLMALRSPGNNSPSWGNAQDALVQIRRRLGIV